MSFTVRSQVLIRGADTWQPGNMFFASRSISGEFKMCNLSVSYCININK